MIKVLLVEDDLMAQKLMGIFIENSGRYQLSGCIESASFAEIYCLNNPVDLILMDVCTALGASGLDMAAKIKKKFHKIKIIIITSQPGCSFITRARAAGVDSFWYKNPHEDEIMEVMDLTMSVESVYPDTTPELKIGFALSIEFTPLHMTDDFLK